MAKELPYFKFEPSEWQNGNIQMCSIEARIIFIDICCTYWQRLGDLPYAFALQRHCVGNKNVLDELESAKVIKQKNGKIVIEFLEEQIEELAERSEKARNSAKKRWKNDSDANAMRTHKKRNANAMLKEEKRIEEKRKEYNKEDIVAYFSEWAFKERLNKSLVLKQVDRAFEYYEDLGFKNSKGKKISNLKTTIKNNWFKLDEIKKFELPKTKVDL